jgi:Fur family peroxide stress response transcriptional regulator
MGQSMLQQLKETLDACGVKVTHQRLVILEAVIKSTNHPTAEQVFEYISKKNPSISLGTVYKTLEIFVAKGLIGKVNTPDGIMRYDGIVEVHNHLFCENTKEIVDFKDEDLLNMISSYLEKKRIENFDIKNIRLHITGEKINTNQEITFQ